MLRRTTKDRGARPREAQQAVEAGRGALVRASRPTPEEVARLEAGFFAR